MAGRFTPSGRLILPKLGRLPGAGSVEGRSVTFGRVTGLLALPSGREIPSEGRDSGCAGRACPAPLALENEGRCAAGGRAAEGACGRDTFPAGRPLLGPIDGRAPPPPPPPTCPPPPGPRAHSDAAVINAPADRQAASIMTDLVFMIVSLSWR